MAVTIVDSTLVTEALQLVNFHRQSDYGDIAVNMRDIADGWTTLLKTGVADRDAALAMVWLKLVRHRNTYKRDNIVDAIAYLLIADAVDDRKPQVDRA